LKKPSPYVKQKIITPPVPVAIDSVPDSIPQENKINEAVPALVDKNEHRLEIKSLDTVWMRISYENGKNEEALLRAGTSKIWEFRGTAKLRIGNAGGVMLNFNGKDLGSPGKAGQVLTIAFPQN